MLVLGPSGGGAWVVASRGDAAAGTTTGSSRTLHDTPDDAPADGSAMRWPVWLGNILHEDPPIPTADLAPGGHDRPTVVAWSGWLGADARPEHGLFPHDPRTWMAEGWRLLEDRLSGLLARFERHGARLLLRPHARHVVSDVPTARRLLERFPTEALGLLLEPTAMLTAAMVPDAQDHLGRIVLALGTHERVAAIVLAGADHPADALAQPGDQHALVPAPLTRGVLPAHDLLGVLEQHGPFDRPVVLWHEALADQLALLARAGVLPSGYAGRDASGDDPGEPR